MPSTAPRRTRGQSAGISLADICDAALDVMDSDGLDAVTVRAVAARLGVHASALYNHVGDKDALLDAVATRALDRLPPIDPTRPVTDELRRLFVAWRDLGARHPGLLRSTGRQWRMAEQVQAALAGAGLTSEEITSTFVALITVTIGSAVIAADLAQLGGEEALRRELSEQIGRLPADDFPTVRDRAATLDRSATLDALFEQQLDAILAPLRSGAASTR